MDSQDGITVRPMRLKVLYTFDTEYKTNCLARWPHVLDIQTAYLDETTPIGVIELRTCIQAIVSASPELVSQFEKDFTVYAYDYSEYETPLVGQGMLSWVLASSSPTPEVPAAESKTMVTGRVCKNPMGIFSKGAGAQETLEVKLRLVPVPTVMQSQYVDNMQKYREMGNSTPQDFDTQSWASLVRQNPGLTNGSRNQPQGQSTVGSPMSGSGIERFHQILSDGATPRELPGYERNETVRSVSPTHSFGGPSRVSTPVGFSNITQQSQSRQYYQSSDMIRPSSSASMRDNDHQMQPNLLRRDSTQSGYASGGEDNMESRPRKRAKLFQAAWPGKSDMNIEKQPSSLRVAASTAASVRIHRPTPVNPSLAAEQSNEEPVRPPTPIMRPGGGPRRALGQSSLLRESSVVSSSAPSYFNSDDFGHDSQGLSPEDSRYQGLFESAFTMPSSPPFITPRFQSQSSPVLPSLALDTDSGFMSGGIEDNFDEEEGVSPAECGTRAASQGPTDTERPCSVRPAVQADSPMSVTGPVTEKSSTPKDQTPNLPLVPQSRPQSSAGSRPSSRNEVRLAPKPAFFQPPPPFTVAESIEKVAPIVPPVPASDPVAPTFVPLQHSKTPTAPMSDMDEAIHHDSGGTKGDRKRKNRAKQIKERLDDAIKKGQVPPFCSNCGCIETPTWRRSWSKVIEGNEDLAKEMMQDKGALFYEVLERDSQNAITKFKSYKKTPAQREERDKEFGWEFVQLCNPCGLWLYKCRFMRPEEKWNKPNPEKTGRKKLPARNRTTGGPLSTRTRSKAPLIMGAASSPAPTEASSVQHDDSLSPPMDEGVSPQVDEGISPQIDEYSEDEAEERPSKRQRTESADLPSSESTKAHWQHRDPVEALQHAIQLSPARNMTKTNPSTSDAPSLTPKPLRRALFSVSNNDTPLKEMNPAMVNNNSPRRSPRFVRDPKNDAEKENQDPAPQDGLDDLFKSPSMEPGTVSPTPQRPLAGRLNAILDRHASKSPTGNQLATSSTRLTAERLQRVQEEHEDNAFAAFDSALLEMFDNENSDLFNMDEQRSNIQSWTDWVPSGYVSPGVSPNEGEPSDALITSILSNPNHLKENQTFDFDSFPFTDVTMPESGYFSDPFNTESSVPPKPQSSQQASSQQKASPDA